jgi:uncharacterized protein YvpB
MFMLLKALALSLLGAALLEPGPPLADSAWIDGFVGYPQQYPLSCEIRSATDVANFWGRPTTEDQLIALLPHSDDPNLGFVGDINAPAGSLPPVGYGVYAAPIAQVLRRWGLDARAHYGFTLDQLKRELQAGRPVIIWGTYEMRQSPLIPFTTARGVGVLIVQWEHTYVAVGYDSGGVYLVDAYDASQRYFDYTTFSQGWSQLVQMAVTVQGRFIANSQLILRPAGGYTHVFRRGVEDLGPW